MKRHLLLVLTTVLLLGFPSLGWGGITLVQQGTTGLSICGGHTSLTVTLPANVTAGNALVVFVSWNNQRNLTSVTGGGVTTWAQAVARLPVDPQSAIWYGLNSSGGTNTVTVNWDSDPNSCGMSVAEFSGLFTSAALDVTATATGSSTTITTGTLTTTNANDLLVAMGVQSSATAGAPTNGFTALTGVSASFNQEEAYNIVSSTGSYSTGWSLSGSSSWPSLIAAFKAPIPSTTTIGDGTNPGNTTLAPGGAATNVDAFTLVTDSGSDTVTAATVTLAAGTSAGLSLVEITNSGGGTVYGSVTNPASDVVSVTGMSLPVTTSTTTFNVRITPKTHANMPAPPGATYAVTATVTAFTSTNSQSGADTASATVTIDNQSPANVTGASATAAPTQVTVSWTNPGDADFSSLVVLRKTATVTDVPVEGTTYSVGNTVGTSTVRYVSSSTTFTDTSLTNGTTYYYRIFAKDTSGNYSATGVEVSATPNPTTTLGTGTNPGNVTLAPGGAATNVNAFTLVTSSGSDTVTAATVTLAAGTSAGLSLVEITNSGGSTVYGSASNPGSDTVSFSTTNSTLSVSTSVNTFKVRITPKTHAAMPAPPGATYAVTATVTSFTSTNPNHPGTDATSATVTIDNQSPANVTAASATPGVGQVTVSWTNPGDADFSSLVVLRKTATITDVPAEGTAYLVGNTVGASTVAYSASGTSFIDTGLGGGSQYFYRIFAKDTNGNYSATGVEVSATLPPAVSVGEVSSVENDLSSGFSWSHTTSGTNRLLVVGVSWSSSSALTVTGMTYAGTAMTSIGSAVNGTNAGMALFYLPESLLPATGTSNTVQVTMSNQTNQLVAGAITFMGVNQTTPVGIFASTTGSSTAASVTVTSNTGETVIDTVATKIDTSPTAGVGQTQRWNPSSTQGSGWGAGSTEPGASSVTMSWTVGNGAWAIGAVGIKPAATCSSVPDATYVVAETVGTQATVYWSSSNPVVILRKTAAFGSEAPSGGASYNVNEAIGATTVVFQGTGTSFTDTGLTAGTTYYYKVFPKTSLPCYAPGIAANVSPTTTGALWGYATAATSMAPPALDPWSNSVVSGSNDNNLHGMVESDGTLKCPPVLTGNPIQARPTTVPAGYRRPATTANIAYATSQDGSVYAVNTSDGTTEWQSPFLPPNPGNGNLQGGVNVWLQAVKSLSVCGVSTSDVVFVGTKDSSTTFGNKVYALNGSGGPVTTTAAFGGNCPSLATGVPAGGILWTYTGSGTPPCSTCMDIISSTPYVDYTNNVVWVTSRAAGDSTNTQPSVWKINASNGTLAGGTPTWKLNDVDSTPVPSADGAFIYVGTNAGTLKAIKVSDGTVVTHTPASTAPCNCTGAGPLKGMPWPLSYSAVSVGTPDKIIFSRNATVHSVNFNGSTFSANWTMTPTGAPATVSTPVDDGAGNLYIGGSDGKMHRILVSNGSDAAQVPATAISGWFGDATFNYDLNKIHVGATDGHIYTFTTPF